ncbi:MAG: glycosyltransferase, partial [Acidobacteria bacterium]
MSERPLGIDFVSPLPPVRSGIADYGADLLPELAQRCDLRLIRLPEQPLDPQLAARYPVAPVERLGDDGRLPLYQMGNNRHHETVYELARRLPGVVTLHDLVLHHFLIGRTVARGDFAAYRRALAYDHGWIGEAASLPLRWPGGQSDAAQFALPAHRRLLDRQRGVLTHSRWAAAMLVEELPGVRVRAMPMGIPLPPPLAEQAGRAFRRRLAVPETAPLLGTFGFQTPMKRTRSVLAALASPELAGAYLLVGGEVAPVLDLKGEARRLGVASRVRFLGFLPYADFEAAIAASDLCLNLRYPTAGETSASLLRILALGKPAVVSDYAQSAELEAGGVVKVPVGEDETPALVAILGRLLADRRRLVELGRAARAYVAAHHRPADAAAAVVAACR